MKTIIHVELSDSDRNDLAKRLARDPDTKHLVTRKEVTEYVNALLQQEMEDGRDQGIEPDEGTERQSDGDDFIRAEREAVDGLPRNPPAGGFIPSRGDEDYIAQPKDPGLAAACSRLLDDCALIETFAWATIERNRRK